MAGNIETTLRIYRKRMQGDEALQRIAKRPASVLEAQKYADFAGGHMAVAIQTSGIITPDLAEEEVDAIMQTLSGQVQKDVARISKAAQRTVLREAGAGLAPLDAGYNPRYAREMAAEVAGKEITEEYLRNQMTYQALRFADEITAVNMQAHENLGLRVRITRRYDGVGLHGGKDPCEWCLDRVGDWDNYADAYNAGAFERHPGCGCLITYEVGKTRTWQAGKGGWSDL